jgi:hypothetical protein
LVTLPTLVASVTNFTCLAIVFLLTFAIMVAYYHGYHTSNGKQFPIWGGALWLRIGCVWLCQIRSGCFVRFFDSWIKLD